MGKLWRDPLVRRLCSGSAFAAAFVWAAVVAFDVETEVVWVFFLLSLLLVAAMAAAGLLLMPLIRLWRSKGPGARRRPLPDQGAGP